MPGSSRLAVADAAAGGGAVLRESRRRADGAGRDGHRSKMVARRVGRSCGGWAPQATAREFYDAIGTEGPTHRQSELLGMWMNEASEGDLYGAWYEGADTRAVVAGGCRRDGVAQGVDLPRVEHAVEMDGGEEHRAIAPCRR